jgi:hypothetical protein
MRLRVRLHVEERLLRIRAVAPGGVVGRFVPHFLTGLRVVVGLGVVRRVVTRLAQILREHAHPVRHGRRFVAAVELRADARAVAHRRQRGARHRADRRVRKRMVKRQPMRRECLDGRCLRATGEEVLQVVDGIVLGNDPNNVRTLGGNGDGGEKEEGSKKVARGSKLACSSSSLNCFDSAVPSPPACRAAVRILFLTP